MTDKARELLEKIVAWWDDDKEFIGDFVEEIRAYLAEPRPDFVRLSEEEVERLMDSALSPKEITEHELYYFARAIEDALEEKNK